MKSRIRFVRWVSPLLGMALSFTLLVAFQETAFAQGYPVKPIRLVVPYVAGAGNDIVGRLLAGKLTESWKQQVVVDNRAGGSTVIGAEIVAKAPPDGYTILFAADATLSINPNLFKKLPYDAAKDFTPVILLATSPFILAVNPSIPAKTVQEFVAYAKANPGKLNFGSVGLGSQHHIAGELLNKRAAVNMIHIPYKGAAQAIPDLLSGRIQLLFTGPVVAGPHVKAGKLRAVAVADAKHTPSMPDLPTFAESGFPGFEIGFWFGLVAPAGTPKEVITKLNGELNEILKMADVRQRLIDQGFEIMGGTPADLAAYIKADTAKWAKFIKETNVSVE